MVGHGRPVRPVAPAPGGPAADVLPRTHRLGGRRGARRAARHGQVPDPLRPAGTAPGAAGAGGDAVSCPHLFDVAPYALGTLGGAERSHVAEHLPGRRECQAVLESVAGLPGLLARVDPAGGARAPAPPGPTSCHRRLARPAEAPRMPGPARRPRARPAHGPAARPEGRRGPRRRLVLAAAAAAVLAAGGGWALREARPDDTTRGVPASSGPVHAPVRLPRTPSGTAVRLELSGVQAEQRCSLIAVDRDGHRTVAATWEAGYTGTATFDGSVPLPADQLASLRVETDTKTLVTFPLS